MGIKINDIDWKIILTIIIILFGFFIIGRFTRNGEINTIRKNAIEYKESYDRSRTIITGLRKTIIDQQSRIDDSENSERETQETIVVLREQVNLFGTIIEEQNDIIRGVISRTETITNRIGEARNRVRFTIEEIDEYFKASNWREN